MKKLIALFTVFMVLGCSKDDSVVNPGDDGPVVNLKKPVANDDTATAVEDEMAVISGLIDNDIVENNARITSFDSESSNGGVITDNRDGTYSYEPPADFTGQDTFTYDLCDREDPVNCSTATVTITVTDAGEPKAEDDEKYTVMAVSRTFFDLAANDDIVDDAVISSVDASMSQGTAVLNEDGSITYTPGNGFKGTDTFTYSLCDDDEDATCATATVTVNVLEAVSFNIPAGIQDYYSDLPITTNKDLNFVFVEDHTSENHTTYLSYGQRHEYLYDADEDLDNPENVILMYTGESRYWEEYTSGSNSYSPQTFNTEHIYPQSKLDSELAVTDLHHLRATDADINSLRLNYPYVDGSGDYELINDSSWFPGDDWKGDVARMIFYLNVRYGENFEQVGSLDLFLKWNIEDPVSEFEIQRNNVIESAQGNRNPFIDNPYLATLIWGGADAENRWE